MSTMPHTAMLLAAGLGTRMRPLTDTSPKPLLELAGRAILHRLLDVLVEAGTERAVVNVHYLAGQIESALIDRKDIEIVISDEREEILETGGALAKARPQLGNDPVFILNTDALWGPTDTGPLERLAESYDPDIADECLLLADTGRCLGFKGAGDFRCGESGLLNRRGEVSRAPWAYAGVRIADPRNFEGLPVQPFSANRLWDRALAAGRLRGIPLDRFWLHVGDPQALEDAEMWMRCHDA
ncbi:MAG: NTP transferase domain-containing protein [Alphaproteobacteria bacterium]|jgi:MurNAc alpha-1-phosphate uridylyltransferase|nr:NTP transferase domain-containing protein [Alphaproteobacteria bacterium]